MPTLVGLAQQAWDVVQMIGFDPAEFGLATVGEVTNQDQAAMQDVQIRSLARPNGFRP